ncbi:MAG: putative baseplate assembly protein [ANME-2 cluster archaeon]|nr:MAG: putative baseplate assembly protein [ANME-2 cluster archaeon]
MSEHPDTSKLNTCDCCKTEIARSAHHNLPGQPAVKYRLGTHAIFLAAMKAHLPGQYIEFLLKELDEHGKSQTGRIYPLQDLTTRASDDPAIALLDAWATIADVLTFYQERIANESYLRTAIERRSVLELARAIGYELKPGVSASTHLAFMVEDLPGSPDMAIVARGARVQSVPSQGQLPQTFETSEEITARAEWNAMRPRMTRPQELAIIEQNDGGILQDKLYLLGISTSFLSADDVITKPKNQIYPLDSSITLPDADVQAVEVQQVYLDGTNTNLKKGDLLLLVGKRDTGTKTIALPIKEVEIDEKTKMTRVNLADVPPIPTFMPMMMGEPVIKLVHLGFNHTHVSNLIQGQTWRERDLNAFMSIKNWNVQNLTEHVNTKSQAKEVGIFRFQKRVSFFGHNAPCWKTLPTNQRYGEYVQQDEDTPEEWEEGAFIEPWDPNGWEIWKQYPRKSYYSPHNVYLEQSIPNVIENSWIVLENAAGERYTPYLITDVSDMSVTGFALSAKVTGLSLVDKDNNSTLTKDSRFKVRNTTAHIQSEHQKLAEIPIEEPLEEVIQEEGEEIRKGVISLMLDQLVLNLKVGQPLIVSGEQEDAASVIQHEVALLKDIQHIGGFTTVYFEDRLQYRYVRKTVTLNANVAHATHGETVHEVLGSGAGSKTHQRFMLKKPPLTYVSASTPNGTRNTLEVRVNNVLWEEVPSLYGLDVHSQKYIVRIDNNAKATVIFGDGKMGARLPSGTENVTTTYRSGIGPGGEVDAGSLTLLQTRPLGIKDVINPLSASGSEAPQDLNKARSNTPQTVLTFDRIVSLRDFEDFSRSFAGIGKARAVAVWNKERFMVHVTIASGTGRVISTDSDLYKNLVDAIGNASDSSQQFQVDSYKPAFFNVKAKLKINPGHQPSIVIAAAETSLRSMFSFEKRTFGQSVTTADVVSVIQNVPGVVAINLDQLYRYHDNQSVPDPQKPDIPDTGMLYSEQADLLLINPVGITLEEMRS